jgi:hypothetical protein
MQLGIRGPETAEEGHKTKDRLEVECPEVTG